MASFRSELHLKSARQRQGFREQGALVQRMMRSDEPALAQFYDATNGLLFGLVLHTLHDTASAEEVLSRVYTDIRQQAAQFDKRRTCLLAWLITIAHWQAHEQLWSGKTSEQLTRWIGPGERCSSALQNPGINRSQHRRLVSDTLASLSPIQLQMIELAYFSRLAPLEIALKLGQRLEIVKVGLQDGMSQLCRLFKNDGPAHINQKAPVNVSLKTGH